MKLASFTTAGSLKYGIQVGTQFADLGAAGFPQTMRAFIEAGAETWAAAEAAVKAGKCPLLTVEASSLAAPVGNPSKIIAIGLNYKDHAAEQNVPLPKAPLIFAKFPSSINTPYGLLSWSPELTMEVDLEVELGVVIGKRARRVSEADALKYVFGYTVLNDVTARDLQHGDKQWVRGKSLDTFCPTGPVIVTADEIPDPQNLAIRSRINDFVMQDSNTSLMVFGVAQLVSYCSQAFTLEPGDLIATGTPNGVGVFRHPPIYLKDGDLVVTEVQGIGRLENKVKL